MGENVKEVEDTEELSLPSFVFPESRVDFLRQILSGTCGRFRLPFTMTEHLTLKVALLAENLSFGKDSFIFSNGVIPPRWQIILRFLKNNGVIKNDSVRLHSLPHGFPKFHFLSLSPVYGPSLSDGRDVSYSGFGIAPLFEESISKAIGEMLERYFLTLHKKSACIFATSAEIFKKKRGFVFPVRRFNTFLRFQTEEFPFLQSTEETKFMWVEGRELLSGSRAYIPAQKIFWNFDHVKEPVEPYLGNSTTSGSAGHFTKEEALLSSIYENAERDSFFLYWLNSLPPPQISLPETLGEPVFDELLASAKYYGLDVYFLDTTSDIAVPSVVCAIVDKNGIEQKMCVGASAGFEPVKILLASLLEAFVLYLDLKNKKQFFLPSTHRPFLTNKVSRAERLLLWQGKKMCERFLFFLLGQKISWDAFLKRGRDFENKKSELDHVLSLFRDLGDGYEVYAYEVQHPLLDSLGYHVVKTVIPKIFPMYLQEHLATLDSERLRKAPAFLGFPENVAQLNPWPHPFP